MRGALVPILFGGPRANRLLGAEAAGVAISFIDGSMIVRDPTTAANNFQGKYTSKLTITGVLTPSSAGATFSASNYARLPFTATPFSTTAGTLIVGFSTNTPGTGQEVVAIYKFSGAGNENMVLFYSNGATAAGLIATAGGVGQASIFNTGTIAANQRCKTVVSWTANDFIAATNGVLGTEDVSGSLPTGMDTFDIGNLAGGSPLLGQMESLVYLPRAAGTVEAKALSAVL